MSGLIVDLFAGGGGASTGLEAALGRPVDLAVNHSATALAVHLANHPTTRHLTADVFEVDPRIAVGRRKVDVLWASPDCTHFSVAKGGAPRSSGTRSLAWVVVDWARAVRPSCIFLENVSEFRTWGPLGADGQPLKSRMGETFAQWRGALELLGYTVDFRVLDASAYGAPTKRRRLFLVARCDGRPIVWPEPTHGPGLLPFHTAAECIDWSLPVPSIFGRSKPLADKTLRRIAAGIQRFVIDSASPFVVTIDQQSAARAEAPVDGPLSTITTKARHALVAPSVVKLRHHSVGSPATEPIGTVAASGNHFGLVAPTLVQTGYGERPGQRPRYLDVQEPLGTVVADGQKHALVATFLAKHFGGVTGQDFRAPIGTITATDHHSVVTAELGGREDRSAEVRAFLLAYYGTGKGSSLAAPMPTVVTRDRFGLVLIDGVEHRITDVGLRMLQPGELLRAQFGRFAAGYDLSAATTKAAKVRLIGNSVAPEVAEAVVRANAGFAARRAA